MPTPGRPKALAEEQLTTVCSLVASGVSIREAARFVDCDPRTVRREAQSNDEFRRQLAKAKSEASVHPLQTLRQAAQDNWRAAAFCMERLDPDRFARPNATIVTQSEANRFVAHLLRAIDRCISDPRDRADFLKLLPAALPAAMRRRWDGGRVNEKIEQAVRECEEKRNKEELNWRAEQYDRDIRRQVLLGEAQKHLPRWLYKKMCQNQDVINPEEEFVPGLAQFDRLTSAAAQPHPSAAATSSPPNEARANGDQSENDSTITEPTDDDITSNASPQIGFRPPPEAKFPEYRPTHTQ